MHAHAQWHSSGRIYTSKHTYESGEHYHYPYNYHILLGGGEEREREGYREKEGRGETDAEKDREREREGERERDSSGRCFYWGKKIDLQIKIYELNFQNKHFFSLVFNIRNKNKQK